MRRIFVLMTLSCFFLISCSKNEGPAKPGNPKKPDEETAKPPASVADCEQCVVLSEQQQSRVAIVDLKSKTIFWEWKASQSNVRSEHVSWFKTISDAKVVYNGKYILACSSDGGVALIRISDKKTMFYAYAGGNTHSAELFPDGNIVSASSTGNYMTLFKVDTLKFPDNVYSKNIPTPDAHNVVWDHKNQLLWIATVNKLKSFKYNMNCSQPDLEPEGSYDLIGTNAHDLFPIYGQNALWITTGSNVYKFDVGTKKLSKADEVVHQGGIKSVSSGPANFPIILSKPKESWWTDEVIDSQGNNLFYQSGLKIYKVRWVLPNAFSYPENNPIKQCK